MRIWLVDEEDLHIQPPYYDDSKSIIINHPIKVGWVDDYDDDEDDAFPYMRSVTPLSPGLQCPSPEGHLPIAKSQFNSGDGNSV